MRFYVAVILWCAQPNVVGCCVVGQSAEPADKDVIETGTEPEFFVTHIARAELVMGGACVRFYIASERSPGVLRVEYTAVCTLGAAAQMARHIMSIAADNHNLLTMAGLGAH